MAVRLLTRALVAGGSKVTIATTNDDGSKALLKVPLRQPINEEGVSIIYFQRNFLPYKISFGLASWLFRNVRHFDIVHIHALFSFSSAAAAIAARLFGVPYIIRPLGVLNQWGLQNRRRFAKRCSLRLVEIPILRRAGAIHYTTEAERREAANIHADIAKRRSFVIPIPVEVKGNECESDDFVRRFPIAAGKRLILFLSRVDQKKGVEFLLKAFAGLRRTEANSLLVIAGDGDSRYVENLRAQAGKLRILENILWTGFLGPVEKSAAFAAATVFVLPSYSENFAIAVAEALAYGLPVIATRGTPWQEIETFRCGWWVEMGAEPLEKALREALALSTEDLREMGQRGQRLMESQYAPSRVVERLEAVYQQIVSGRPAPAQASNEQFQ